MPSREESALKAVSHADGGGTHGAGTPDVTRRLLLQLSEKFGVPAIDLGQLTLTLADLDLIPQEISTRHVVLPLLVKDEAIFLGMAAPSNKQVIEEIEFVSGKKVYPYVTDPELLASTIQRAYELKSRGVAVLAGERSTAAARQNVAPPPVASPAVTLASPSVEAPRPPGVPPPVPPPVPSAMRSRRPTIVSNPGTASPPVVPMPPGSPPTQRVNTPSVPAAAVTPRSAPIGPSAVPAGGEPSPSAVVVQPPPGGSTVGKDPPSHPEEDGVNLERGSSTVAMEAPVGLAAPRTVLVIDAEGDARRLLRAGLEEQKYRVLEADRAEVALAALQKSMVDLVVIDPNLPDLHGFELCARIRADARTAGVPIVMVSAEYVGWRYLSDFESAFGVRAMIQKPLGIVEALQQIESVVEDKPPPPEADVLSHAAETALKAGTTAYHKGDLDVAIGHLERGVVAAPESYRIRYQLALLLGRRGEHFRAIHELERSVALYGRFFAALKNLAVLYEKAGFRRKATEAWERSLLSAPDDATRAQIKERLLALL